MVIIFNLTSVCVGGAVDMEGGGGNFLPFFGEIPRPKLIGFLKTCVIHMLLYKLHKNCCMVSQKGYISYLIH